MIPTQSILVRSHTILELVLEERVAAGFDGAVRIPTYATDFYIPLPGLFEVVYSARLVGEGNSAT